MAGVLDLLVRQGQQPGGGGEHLAPTAVAEVLAEVLDGVASDHLVALIDERLGRCVASRLEAIRQRPRASPWGVLKQEQILLPLWHLTKHHLQQ